MRATMAATAALLCLLQIGCGQFALEASEDNGGVVFTSVPAYGSTADLRGSVDGLSPDAYSVYVCIYVHGWWSKPTWDEPATPIQPDGTWTCDITTGGADETATRIAAYVIPRGLKPPLMTGEAAMAPAYAHMAVASVEVTRPPYARIIDFSGYQWGVKTSATPVGPGPNYFSDSGANVWVDGAGLHLKIIKDGALWQCAEVVCTQSLGYGRYTFSLGTDASLLDEWAVLGLFTWDDADDHAHREIDIECSRWGVEGNENAQFVVQPFDALGNRHRFDIPAGIVTTTHSFDWRPDRITFTSVEGQPVGAGAAAAGDTIAQWTYTGPDIPPPGNENARLNLWLYEGTPPSDAREIEVLITGFAFEPVGR